MNIGFSVDKLRRYRMRWNFAKVLNFGKVGNQLLLHYLPLYTPAFFIFYLGNVNAVGEVAYIQSCFAIKRLLQQYPAGYIVEC